MEETNNGATLPTEAVVDSIVTAEDLALNPELAAVGVEVGDAFGVAEVEIPAGSPTPEQITPEMREAGIDETTPIMTREAVVAELGEEAVKKIEDEAVDATEEEPEVELEVSTRDAAVLERIVPFVQGELYEGRQLIAAEWNGDKLVVENEDHVKFTLTGEELEKFLA